MTGRRFLLLERDGTTIVERDSLSDPAGVGLLSGSISGRAQHPEQVHLGCGGYQSIRNTIRISELYLNQVRYTVKYGHISFSGSRFDRRKRRPAAGAEAVMDVRRRATGSVYRPARGLNVHLTASFVLGEKDGSMAVGRHGAATKSSTFTSYSETMRPTNAGILGHSVTRRDQAISIRGRMWQANTAMELRAIR